MRKLNSVEVPPPLEPVFLKAQAFVERYFSDRFENHEEGSITISGERYVLVRGSSLSVDFFEQVAKLYESEGGEQAHKVASGLLFDIAHAQGRANARAFHKKMHVEDPIDKLSAGPIHFAFSGWAKVRILPESKPSPDENFFLFYDHPYAFEADAWLSSGKKPDFPVCIMNAGYSSGWCQESFGVPLVAVEIECKAKGDKNCRFVMAPPSRIREHLQRIRPGILSDETKNASISIPEFFVRKRLEQTIRDSEARFRALFENMSSGVAVYDATENGDDFVFRDINQTAERISKIRKKDLEGRTVTSVFPSVREMGLLDVLKRVWQTGIPERYPEILYSDDRLSQWVENYVYKLPSGQIVAVYDDVTENREAKLRLERAHKSLDTILESVPLGVVVIGQEKTIRWANRMAQEMIGVTNSSELLGTPCSDYFCPDRKENEEPCVQDTGEMVAYAEKALRRKDGSDIPIIRTITKVTLNDEEQLLVTFLDIRERKQMESDLLQARKLEAVGQLAAGIAHEINTPVQFVSDNIRFLKGAIEDLVSLADKHVDLIHHLKNSKLSPDDLRVHNEDIEKLDFEFLREELPSAIQEARDGLTRVTQLVLAMKEFSHPGTSDKTSADLNEAIQTTITVTRNEWKYVADLDTNLDTNLPSIPCYISELNQAILNMIINARDAIADVVGNSGEKGTITISTTKEDNTAEIRIQDTGTGIPEKIQERVFDPFFTTKEIGKGTGQGLAISRNIVVEKHGGELLIESEQGKGTTLIIRLPLS